MRLHTCRASNRRGKLFPMPTVALRAHYDGERIILDEPYELPANSSLMVTVLPVAPDGDSENNWLRAAMSSDALAEDIYAITDGKPFCDAR
jgi:hypothetical protein